MIYFDCAATSMQKPQSVVDAVAAAMSTFGSRGSHEPAINANRAVFASRLALAKLFGAEPSRIAFTANATDALNIIINGMFVSGDHIITTALEHNSVLRPLYRLEERGAKLSIIGADDCGRLNYDGFEKHLRPNTKAVICTHASNLIGDMPDIGFISNFCEKHGLLFILDASQTAGAFPIDVSSLRVDALAFTGHKSLLGPQGTGGLYLRGGVEIEPQNVGGSGAHSFSRQHPPKMPDRLEAGTLNAHGIAGLLAGVDFITETGVDVICETERGLAEYFSENAAKINGVKIYGGKTENRAPIVALNVSDADSGEISDILSRQYGICVRSGIHCAPLLHEALGTAKQGAVRFSFSFFNTVSEADAGLSALDEIAARFA